MDPENGEESGMINKCSFPVFAVPGCSLEKQQRLFGTGVAVDFFQLGGFGVEFLSP